MPGLRPTIRAGGERQAIAIQAVTGSSGSSPGWRTTGLQRAVDSIDALLQPVPFLLGEQPTLCDFALFGQLVD